MAGRGRPWTLREAPGRLLDRAVPRYADEELRTFAIRMLKLGGIILGLLAAGTIAFVATAGTSVWNGFVLALDTVATVGSIPAPTGTGPEIVKVVLIVLGVGTLFYALVTVTEFVVRGRLADLLGARRAQRMIDSLSDHCIVCGYGRVGRQVTRDLAAAGAAYVIVSSDPKRRADAVKAGDGDRFILGAASEDEVLLAAGVERARSLLACVDSDAENIFLTLTARGLSDRVEIVARAAAEASVPKLRRAGADRVVSPYELSGAEMARLALHPNVPAEVDVAPEYRLEEIEVVAGCQAEGAALGDVRGGAIVVAIRRADGTTRPHPGGATVLAPGDVIVAMGPTAVMGRLERRLGPAAGAAPR